MDIKRRVRRQIEEGSIGLEEERNCGIVDIDHIKYKEEEGTGEKAKRRRRI